MAINAMLKNTLSKVYKVVDPAVACINQGRRFIQKLVKETTTDVGSFTVATNVIKDIEAKAAHGLDEEARMILSYLFPGSHNDPHYDSPLPDEVVFKGISMRHITVNAMYDAMDAAGRAALTVENMIRICKDWEAFARAGQEGILDSIKNGWRVFFLLLKKLETIQQLSRKRKATRKWEDSNGEMHVEHDFNIEAKFGAQDNIAELQAEGYDLIRSEDDQAVLCVAVTEGETEITYDKEGNMTGMVVDDLLHRLMNAGMDVMKAYGVQLINLRPERADEIVKEAEAAYESSPVFRHAVHQYEGMVNAYRTLVNQRLAALDRIDDKDIQSRASVTSLYRDGFNEVTNVCRGLAKAEGLDLVGMELVSFYVSSHGVSKDEGWHAYTLMEMSSFAHSICEEEFALFWFGRLKELGYEVPEWTEDPMSEGTDIEENLVVDFVLGEPVDLQREARCRIHKAKAELKKAKESGDESAVKAAQREVNAALNAHFHGHCENGITGRYMIRRSHGHLVASQPLFEEKDVTVGSNDDKLAPVMQQPEFDPSHWCWVTSHTKETADGIDAFIDTVKDHDCYVVDSLKAGNNYCHVVLVEQNDGTFKIVSRFRPFGFDRKNGSDDHREGSKDYSKEEANTYRRQDKRVNTLIGLGDMGKKCLKGKVYSVLAGEADGMLNAVVLMKDCEKVEITDAMRAAAFDGNVQQLDEDGNVQFNFKTIDPEALLSDLFLSNNGEEQKVAEPERKPIDADQLLSGFFTSDGEVEQQEAAPEEDEPDQFADGLDEAMGAGEDFESDYF